MGLEVFTLKTASAGKDHDYQPVDITFSIDEWGEFFDELNVLTLGPYVDGEDMVERDRKERELFRAALSDFPMLSRIDEYYADVQYTSAEVTALLKECEAILPGLSNSLAISFARGLILSCETALRSDSGLFLMAD